MTKKLKIEKGGGVLRHSPVSQPKEEYPEAGPPTKDSVEAIKKTEVVLANAYFASNMVGDFSKIEEYKKLTLLQNTPQIFIKSRVVGKIKVPYIPHEYAEKCLNFVFNFQVSSEILEHEMKDIVVGGKNTVESMAVVKFTLGVGENKIVRTVVSGHRSYANPATTRADALKSAISKAWTVVARTFGIGSNLVEAERKAYAKAACDAGVIDGEVSPAQSPTQSPTKKVQTPIKKVPSWKK